MVTELARQAVCIKCRFENAKLTGNYECAYALGILSAQAGLPKKETMDNLSSLAEEVFAAWENKKTDDEKITKLCELTKDYEIHEDFDNQMLELYQMGYRDMQIP